MKRISERIALLSEMAGAMHLMEAVETLRQQRTFAGGTGASGFTDEAPSNAGPITPG